MADDDAISAGDNAREAVLADFPFRIGQYHDRTIEAWIDHRLANPGACPMFWGKHRLAQPRENAVVFWPCGYREGHRGECRTVEDANERRRQVAGNVAAYRARKSGGAS